MKILSTLLCLSTLTTGAFSQGIVNFANSPSTLVSFWGPPTWQSTLISGPAGSFYFGLLVAPSGTDPVAFTFTGVYATNSGVAPGRFVRNGVQVSGWQPGEIMSYEVAAWSAELGPGFNPQWLTCPPCGPFTVSGIGMGAAGGTDASGHSLPPLPLFGGATGIASGFTFAIIPEPSCIALAGLAGVTLLISHRRK